MIDFNALFELSINTLDYIVTAQPILNLTQLKVGVTL